MCVKSGCVCLDDRHGYYWLTLNRPRVVNAFDEEMLRELVGVLDTINGSGQPLIITGAGRAFCTGGDLKAYLGRLDDPEALQRYFLLLADVFGRIVDYPGGTVAAVNGVAVAGAWNRCVLAILPWLLKASDLQTGISIMIAPTRRLVSIAGKNNL